MMMFNISTKWMYDIRGCYDRVGEKLLPVWVAIFSLSSISKFVNPVGGHEVKRENRYFSSMRGSIEYMKIWKRSKYNICIIDKDNDVRKWLSNTKPTIYLSNVNLFCIKPMIQ